jgi:DGQHR domain-containing protein
MPKKKRKSKKKKLKLSPEEQKRLAAQKAHIKEARSIFKLVGFSRVPRASKFEIKYQGTTSDLDDLFLFENLVVLLEYTTKQIDLSGHLKKKKVLYDKIQKDTGTFIEFLDQNVKGFGAARGSFFEPAQMRVAIVYCSLKKIENELKAEVPGVRYLDYQYLKYFLSLARAIKMSARFEVFDFLGFKHADIGKNVISASAESATYEGSILPEAHSSFGKDHKIVSFYVDPGALLNRCYVLRKDRWEETSNLYQRLISKKKLEAIRKYLLDQKRVFVNNIIVTLPEETHLLDSKGNTVDPSKIQKTSPIRIHLPSEHNSIGLIDGQHRVFSYYEGGKNEQKIGHLREQQNLLVTGIVYPNGMTKGSKTKFEAKLFLEINATQTNAKSDLKQAIGLLLKPFSAESIAKDVVNHLNDSSGPLFDAFERYFYEKNKLKTTSVVSYAVKPIVKFTGKDSFFYAWKQTGKNELLDEKNAELRKKYVEYCAKHINQFLSAAKVCASKEKWTADKKVSKRLLTTTNINGLIICLRKVIESSKVHDFEYYKTRFGMDLATFPFGKYKSSQYTRMGQDLFEKFFSSQ